MLVEHLTGNPVEGRPSAEELDAAWAAFLAMGEEDTATINGVINVLGLAFGDIVVRELGLEWVVASDRYGTEIAVLGQPGDQISFPTVAVAKRWQTKETGFLAPLLEAITEDRRLLRGD